MAFMTNLFRSGLFAAAAAVALIPAARADDHMVVKESERGVIETIDTLQAALEEKGISIVSRVDHQANAKKAGLDLPPTLLLIFGNPKLGTPLMLSNRQVGVDLPMKALAWEADGKVYLGYTHPEQLKERYDIDDKDEVFGKMTKALDGMTDKATKK